MPSIFLDAVARLLVVVHAVAAIVLVGSSTHHALISIGYVRGVYKVRLGRIYAMTVAATWVVTFAFGCLAYPTFRYSVRALYLDQHEPWASNLFDIKENFAALGLPVVIGVFVLSRVLEPKQQRGVAIAYTAMVLLATVIVWFDVVSGLLITMAKGV